LSPFESLPSSVDTTEEPAWSAAGLLVFVVLLVAAAGLRKRLEVAASEPGRLSSNPLRDCSPSSSLSPSLSPSLSLSLSSVAPPWSKAWRLGSQPSRWVAGGGAEYAKSGMRPRALAAAAARAAAAAAAEAAAAEAASSLARLAAAAWKRRAR
jgi:hypothetical protein